MLDPSTQGRETETKQGVNGDEIKVKPVGAQTAYSRELTPSYEVCRGYVDKAIVMKGWCHWMHGP